MPIEKVDGVWAETGTREPTLTDAKKTTGFVGGDQPEIERFNELIGRSDDKLDEIIRERVNTHYDGSADHQLAISTGIWPDAWAMGGEAANTISAGGTKEIRDLAVFFTSAGYPRLLLLDNANTKIEVWDPRALSNTDTSDALTDDLPSGGGEVWECVSMATDGTSVYCTFKDTNAAPDAHRLQAWDISTWDVKTGWAATGTALSGTGNGPIVADCRDSKVIVADATNLAVSCGWTNITAAGDPAIQLFLMSDGSAVRDGAGDCTTGVNLYPAEDLVSDGTNIFFIAGDAANSTKLCSATIADLTAGSGGAGYPRELSTATANGARLCNVGADHFASVVIGDTAAAATIALRTHDSSAAARSDFKLGIDSSAAAITGDEIVMDQGCWSMVFDGINLFALTDVNNLAGHTLNAVKVDAGHFKKGAAPTTDIQWTDICSVYSLHSGVSPIEGVYQNIIFDGRDIWASIDPRASQTHSGKLYRIPLAALRS
jgi:hypothetical protein